ncbi:hypothetical protein AtubIFM54640_010819 [Aspergillus tubingensis]|nr:hypothetical protein AtubIFM54640_010819 [Aspergillus tubingensis]
MENALGSYPFGVPAPSETSLTPDLDNEAPGGISERPWESLFLVDVKRVRDQKQLALLRRKVEEYEQLLQDLEKKVDKNAARSIRKAHRLIKKGSDTPSPTDFDSDSDSANSSIVSLSALELVEEDLNRSERTVATGFIGKNSEIT